MKILAQRETHSCDCCGRQEDYVATCMRCGKEHCYTCRKTEGVEYSHGVYVTGTGDGYYCVECDAALTLKGDNARHKAYRRVASLRLEAKAWDAEFERRRVEAEKSLEALQK